MRLFRRPAFLLGLGVLVVAIAVSVVWSRGPLVATATAARTDLEQHLIASGRVRVVTRVGVSSQVAGRVVAVRAVDGQRVKAGDLLVQLDDAEATAAVAQARAAVNQASSRLEQLRSVGAIVTGEASRQAAATLAYAEAELARIQSLAAAGAVSRADLEDARRNAEIARAQKAAAEAQETAAAPRGVDSAIAMAALVQSQAQLASATARLGHTRLLAPESGVVLRRAVEPGVTVQPGAALLEIAADGETQLVIEPDERNLAWIRPGQAARASADAFPADVFDAEVSYIAPAIDRQRGSIEVRLRVPSPPAFLKPDMTVSVDLTVAARKGVVAVPRDAVRGAATAAPWVPVVEAGRIVRRPVTLGITGTGHVEVLSGLEPGAVVVVSTDVVLTDGQRVRLARGDR